MKLNPNVPEIRKYLFDGSFGIEKESLRVRQENGRFAQTLHPFSHPCIVQDFAENQTEVNTEVCSSWKEARKRCEELTVYMLRKLSEQGEVLWPFSNPGPIDSADEIPVLKSGSEKAVSYRKNLEKKYGKMKMCYSGIHYNFSFDDRLLKAQYSLSARDQSFDEYKSAFYLNLVSSVVKDGWIIDLLLNASPVYDGSLLFLPDVTRSGFAGMSSMRNSQFGYWNFFTPHFDYSSMEAYASSIERYVDAGLLMAPRELYYPVRLKPAGGYSLDALRKEGASHIELRMIDLNPYELSGISKEDAWFCHLFLIYEACMGKPVLGWKEQIEAEQNFKNASRYEINEARILFDDGSSKTVRQAGIDLLDSMEAFFANLECPKEAELIRRQKQKLNGSYDGRLCVKVRRDFPDFDKDALRQALALQDQALKMDCSDRYFREFADTSGRQ